MAAELESRLIKTLEFPRYLVRAELDLEDCPHDGVFAAHDLRCQECLNGDDCHWLYDTDDTIPLEHRSLDQLIDALGYALESISGLLNQDEHDPHCHCQTCLWCREADALYGEVRCHPMLEPPPVPVDTGDSHKTL
jgi:hypothetical protein